MFQRIQTIYLTISLIAWGILFFTPVLAFSNDAGGVWGLFANGIQEADTHKVIMRATLLTAYYSLVAILLLVSMFTFKKLDLQLRLTTLSMILQILSYGVIAVYVMQGKTGIAAHPVFIVATILPIVAALFAWLASRGIKKDIELLKSLDRLR